jgi:hypothetical protein
MFSEKVIPLTLNELVQLTASVPVNIKNSEEEIEIVANEDRVVIRDLRSKLTLSWILRNKRKMPSG